MNEKKAILLMLLILHDGRTSRLLPPTNAIVNTKRPEDKFPLEKRSLNMEAPLKYQFGATKTLKMATYQHGTFERTNVTTLQHPSRQGTALRLNQGNFDDMQNIAMNNLQNNHNGSERVQALRRLAKRSLDQFTAIEVSGQMIGAITGAMIPIPVLGAIASVFIGVAFNIIADVSRASMVTPVQNYLTSIRQNLKEQAISSMKMKLRSYARQIGRIFDLFGLPMLSVEAAVRSIKQTRDLTSNEVIQTLNTINRTMDASHLREIYSSINAFLTDIENDDIVFLFVDDPTDSIVFLQEFCMMRLTTFSAALALRKHLGYGTAFISNLQSRAKDAAKGCYKFAKWAIHKTAGIVEDNSEHPRNVYNNFLKNVKSMINLDLFSSIGDVDIGEAYLKHGDQISLKHTNRPTNTDKRWMSCWGSGNWCKLRSCPGTNAPFETGSQYDYGVACRGEIFWIFGFGRYPNQKILTCDTVGLQYSVWGDDHYWLSKAYGFLYLDEIYKTRTCPGNSFESSIWRSECSEERFEIQVEGKLCGENVEDRDAIQLMSKSNNKYVAVSYKWNQDNLTTRTLKAVNYKPDPWRLYNHNSPTVKPY